MEFPTVVHENGGLNFKASKALWHVIAFIKGRLFSLLCSLWIVFLYWTIKLFVVSGTTINPVFLVAELIFTTVSILVSNYLVSRIGPVLVMIAWQVTVANEMVSVTPFTFSLRFWKKPSNRIQFKLDELRIRKTDNPLKFTKTFDNRVFELRDKTKKAYIVFDYFDPLLKEKLTDILVEVTPPELLIPGRLRHY